MDAAGEVGGGGKGVGGGGIAAVREVTAVAVDGVGNCGVEDMARDNPADEEDDEGEVTESCVAEVFQEFCGLVGG